MSKFIVEIKNNKKINPKIIQYILSNEGFCCDDKTPCDNNCLNCSICEVKEMKDE
jgi:hypothetical protein